MTSRTPLRRFRLRRWRYVGGTTQNVRRCRYKNLSRWFSSLREPAPQAFRPVNGDVMLDALRNMTFGKGGQAQDEIDQLRALVAASRDERAAMGTMLAT